MILAKTYVFRQTEQFIYLITVKNLRSCTITLILNMVSNAVSVQPINMITFLELV